jgi:hypothetical protein
MQHIDDDRLALLALAQQRPEPDVAAHLDGCERCRLELRELSRVVTAGRSTDTSTGLTPPAPHVWAGIAAAVGIDESTEPPTETPRAVPERASTGATSRRVRPVARRSLPTWLAVAAGVAIGAAGAVVVQVVGSDDAPQAPAGSLVATAELAEFGDTGTSGIAEVRSTDGARVVSVSLDEAPQGSGFREVWLLDTEKGNLISLGVLTGTESTFPLPEDLDLRDYPTIDVSREPLDGDPTHSADSIARGDLQL